MAARGGVEGPGDAWQRDGEAGERVQPLWATDPTASQAGQAGEGRNLWRCGMDPTLSFFSFFCEEAGWGRCGYYTYMCPRG
jgi:hypothetical protein